MAIRHINREATANLKVGIGAPAAKAPLSISNKPRRALAAATRVSEGMGAQAVRCGDRVGCLSPVSGHPEVRESGVVPITIFDSDSIPRDRRAELEAAVIAAGRCLHKQFEGWIVATPDRRGFAVRITSYPEVDISLPFAWNATDAEVTQQVRAALED